MVKEVKEVKEENNSKKKNNNTIITSKVLFVTVLNVILFVALALFLLISTITNFAGNVGSMSYNFGGRLFSELLIIIYTVILYFLYNWIYKCINKTMLCLTEHEVYIEKYFPLIRHETTIPLNKITGISTHRYIYIFRVIVIHQYQKLPILFWTWTNQEFKDELDKLITTRTIDKKPINDNEDKNIIPKEKLKLTLIITGAVIGVIIFLSGVASLFGAITNPANNIKGTYVADDKEIVLNKDGTCDIAKITTRNITECTWEYSNKDEPKIVIEYEYTYGYYNYKYSDDLTLTYNKNDKTLTYDKINFIKK